MDYNEFSWERQTPLSHGAALSAADIEALTRLMIEVRDMTLSRSSYIAATNFLKRFGHDTGISSIVQPEAIAR